MKEAVTDCIANDILSDFLKEQGGRIVSILTAEYSLEAHMRVYGEELLEDRNEEIGIPKLRHLIRVVKPVKAGGCAPASHLYAKPHLKPPSYWGCSALQHQGNAVQWLPNQSPHPHIPHQDGSIQPLPYRTP